MGYNEIAEIAWISPSGTPLDIPGTPLGHTGPAQPEPSPDGPASSLDTLNGAFKVGPKAGHRRLQVKDPGDWGLGGAVGPLQSAI